MSTCGEREARMAEKTNHNEGRSGSKCKVVDGPAAGAKKGNPTMGGGINRATKGV